jgi:signal peptidase II
VKHRRGWTLFFFAVLFLIIDAASKYWVNAHLPAIQSSLPFYPYGGMGVFQNVLGIDFSINKTYNTGGAWSLFSNFPHALLISRIGIIIGLFTYTLGFNKNRARDIPLLLILTGAIGNIIDFFLYGAVIDMFYFVLWGYSYPIFNVADALIFFGVASLLIQELLKKRQGHAAKPSQN